MVYHLFLNSFRKVVKIVKAFSRKLAVPRYMSTSVAVFESKQSRILSTMCHLVANLTKLFPLFL